MISGDMNVHWEYPNVSKSAISNWCQSFGFEQIITDPTRIHSRNGVEVKSVIDLCLSRTFGKNIKPTVVDLPFSDHKGIVVKLGKTKHKKEVLVIKKWSLTPAILHDASLNPCQIDQNSSDIEKLAEELTD